MEQTTSQTYVAEVYEAIRLFTDNYIIYSNVLQELKEAGKKSQDPETLATIKQAVSNLRRFEKHAYIRFKAISGPQKIDLSKIIELREALKSVVPSEAETELLVIEYHKIMATKITENAFGTETGKVDDLTGNV